MVTKEVKYPQLASFFLRLGIGAAFLYAGIATLLAPSSWIGFFPAFVRSILPEQVLMSLFSVYQIALALWLISGQKGYYAALLASLTLIAIVFTNIYSLDIVFRDIAILSAALALAVLEKR